MDKDPFSLNKRIPITENKIMQHFLEIRFTFCRDLTPIIFPKEAAIQGTGKYYFIIFT